ncbi:MAG: CopG family transcriptional regulator [Thermodesulfobacteriota bacterium]
MTLANLDLTSQEQAALETLAERSGQTVDELVRGAVRELIRDFLNEDRLGLLKQAKGMWKDRTDLPLARDLRREWDRWAGNDDGCTSPD